MAASSEVTIEIPEKKARLTPPDTPDGDNTDALAPPGPSHAGLHSGKPQDQEEEDAASEISNISGLDEEMESRWLPERGPMGWIQLQMLSGADPRPILQELLPNNIIIPDDVEPMKLWHIVMQILSEPPRRTKLKEYNTLDDAVRLIQKCKKIVVLTGAGISVSCGIPDFRSKDGIYAKLAVEYPDLGEPQDMFDIHFFTKNPKPFFKFASEIYPGQFIPSVSHKFIRKIEQSGKLLRNYSQNIDTLEQCAGIENVVQCHGSFATASCMSCKFKVSSDDIKDDIMQQKIPRCPHCTPEIPTAVMKPDIVFFGEGLPEEFHKQMELDKDNCDLLIVIGSSLKVRPVALIPNSLPAHVPQILINREPLRHLTFDIQLLGNCDVIVETLARRLGWDELSGDVELKEADPDTIIRPPEPEPKQPTHDVINDDSTCDSMIETIQECHICGSASEECPHTPDEDTKPEPTASTSSDVKTAGGNVTEANDVNGAHVNGDVPPVMGPIDVRQAGDVNVSHDVIEASNGIVHHDVTAGGDVEKEPNADESELEPVSHDFELDEISLGEAEVVEERKSLAEYMPEGTYVFVPPNTYLFPGGELYALKTVSDSDSDDSESENEDEGDESPEELKRQLENPRENSPLAMEGVEHQELGVNGEKKEPHYGVNGEN